jgi:hypothetical protein
MLYLDALHAATDYKLDGYNDWSLPSAELMSEIFVQIPNETLTGITNDFYWSSMTEHAARPAPLSDVTPSNPQWFWLEGIKCKVRPVRRIVK